jgi:hypothetical protein
MGEQSKCIKEESSLVLQGFLFVVHTLKKIKVVFYGQNADNAGRKKPYIENDSLDYCRHFS